MTKTWFWVAAVSVVVVAAFYFGQKASHKYEAWNVEISERKSPEPSEGAKPESLLASAKMYLARPFGRPNEILIAKALLGYIREEEEDYAEARRLLAKLPSDAVLRQKMAKAVRASQRREKKSGEWSKERIEASLRDPAVKERMQRDLLKMHDAIKELYGPEAALRFLQGK